MHPFPKNPQRAALSACLALPACIATASPAQVDGDTRAYNLAHGRVVFTEHCLRCHEEGRKGAPMLAEPDDWAHRLDQPLEEMIRHAINGHGDMPARGETELANQEIAAAVAYVVSRARLVAAKQIDALPATAAGGMASADSDNAAPTSADEMDDAVINMFLLLIGKERWR